MHRLLVAVLAFISLPSFARAQGRTEITANDTGFQAENLTSSQDGSVYFVCNDMAIAPDGTVYATESFANRVHRLKPGASALDLWVTDQRFGGIDGIALLADGAVYVNTFFGGELFRIPVNADGGAGTIVKIETSLPLGRPDGLRTIGPRTLIQAEGQGRIAELTIDGTRADVHVVKDGLPGASGVTIVGDTALVLVGGAKAVVVPYRRQ